MNITVIGGGYIGIIASISFCGIGNTVCIVEFNKTRLNNLKAGQTDVYEPGINNFIDEAVKNKKLIFSGDLAGAVSASDAVIVAVSIADNGKDCDLTILNKAISIISSSLQNNKYTPIVIMTNVPVGTCSTILENIKFARPDLILGKDYDLISNPCHCREGCAIKDFMTQSRVIIGLSKQSEKAKKFIETLYSNLSIMNIPFIYTNFETAELIRSASIALSSVRMAFINEISDLCEKIGGNIDDVIHGISSDHKIYNNNMSITASIGGSSYPRTIRILNNVAKSYGVNLKLLDAVLDSNSVRIHNIYEKIINLIKDKSSLSSKRVTILGLTFKPLTNDIRESASLLIVEKLIQQRIPVYVYDPTYLPDSKNIVRIPDKVINSEYFYLTKSVYEAVTQSNIIVAMTEWAEFYSIDFSKVSELMAKSYNKKPVFLDCKNSFINKDLSQFKYISTGMYEHEN